MPPNGTPIIYWHRNAMRPSTAKMRILGALLAGGKARRFGSDKAHAHYHGWRLIDLVRESLAAQCEAVVVCGREEEGFACLPDRPCANMGPLGGINAALHHAEAEGFDAVLSAACDIPNLPPDLAQILDREAPEGPAAIVQSQPVVGLWRASLARDLEGFLQGGGRRLYDFGSSIGARMVAFDPPLLNINRAEDLPDHSHE